MSTKAKRIATYVFLAANNVGLVLSLAVMTNSPAYGLVCAAINVIGLVMNCAYLRRLPKE